MKTSGQGKAGQVEAIYEAIQARVLQKLAAATREAKAGDKLSYHTVWGWVCEATRELMQPTIFSEGEGIDQAIKEYGPEVYLDDIMRRVILGEPPTTLTLTRTPLTPEVFATLNSDPEAIYKRLFPTPPAEIDIEELLTREIALSPTDPDRYKIDLNFLRYPSFSLRRGKKTGNRVRYEGTRIINGKEYRVITAIGTIEGVLTPFDYDVLFRGICSYIRHDEITGRWYASFKTNDILNRIGKPVNDKGGGFYKMIYNSLRKLPTFSIEHNTYISGPEGEPEHLTANMFDRVYNPETGDDKKDHRFIFTASLGQALSNKYTHTFSRQDIKGLPDPISKRVYEILSDLLKYRESQNIRIDTLAKQIPLEDSNKARRRGKVIKALKVQDRFHYNLAGDTLMIRKAIPKPTKPEPAGKVEEDIQPANKGTFPTGVFDTQILKAGTNGGIIGQTSQVKPKPKLTREEWERQYQMTWDFLKEAGVPESKLPRNPTDLQSRDIDRIAGNIPGKEAVKKKIKELGRQTPDGDY